MGRRKRLQDLTIKDNFMFAAAMMEGDNCQRFLEMVLGIPIDHVEISYEKTIVYHPECKGVRLDVYAKDENNTRFDVEMQVQRMDTRRRSRYYHSQIDMDMLQKGHHYDELADAYVIFVCDYDPFGLRKYRYTFENICWEENTLRLADGSYTIILSTEGENSQEVPEELVKFLAYVKSNREDSEKDFDDNYVCQLQRTIQQIKQNRELGDRYMLLEELMEIERKQSWEEGKAEGKAESVLELLEDIDDIPDVLRQQILEEKDIKILGILHKAAAKAESLEQFEEVYHRIMAK